MNRVTIKSDGNLHMTEVTTESGEELHCSDIEIKIVNRRFYAVLTIPDPTFDIKTEYEIKKNG